MNINIYQITAMYNLNIFQFFVNYTLIKLKFKKKENEKKNKLKYIFLFSQWAVLHTIW